MNAAGTAKKSLTGTFARYRIVLVLLALAAVCVVALAVQADSLREQWLSRQSLSDLKNMASARDADTLTHYAFGQALFDSARFSDAAAEFQRAELMLEPGRRDAAAERVHARLGYTLALLGNFEKAVSCLDRARQIDRNNWLVNLGDGAVLLNKQMPKPAIAKFQTAVTQQPQSYEAYYMLGLAQNEDSDPKAAAESLKRAAALAPKFAPAHAELGHALAYLSLIPEAVEQFRAARKLDPQSRDYLFALGDALGRSARTPEQYREAAAVLEECRNAAPQNPNLLFTLGQLHLRFMNLQEAYRCLKRTTEIRPSIAKAWYNLGRVEQLLGDEKEANHAAAVFRNELALHDNAIRAEKRVVADLRDPAARLELFRCFRDVGNIIGAYTQLKIALDLEPDYAPAHEQMLHFQMEHDQELEQVGESSARQNDSDRLGPPPPDGQNPTERGARSSQP